MQKIILSLAITVIFISFSYAQQSEQITITTYYPSPYGSYRDLEVHHQLRAKGKGADANLAIHATTNLGKSAASSGAGTYAVYGEILNTIDPDVTEGVGSDVLGGIGKVWIVGGTSTQAGVYGSAPLSVPDQYAGYFEGNVRADTITADAITAHAITLGGVTRTTWPGYGGCIWIDSSYAMGGQTADWQRYDLLCPIDHPIMRGLTQMSSDWADEDRTTRILCCQQYSEK